MYDHEKQRGSWSYQKREGEHDVTESATSSFKIYKEKPVAEDHCQVTFSNQKNFSKGERGNFKTLNCVEDECHGTWKDLESVKHNTRSV